MIVKKSSVPALSVSPSAFVPAENAVRSELSSVNSVVVVSSVSVSSATGASSVVPSGNSIVMSFSCSVNGSQSPRKASTLIAVPSEQTAVSG